MAISLSALCVCEIYETEPTAEVEEVGLSVKSEDEFGGSVSLCMDSCELKEAAESVCDKHFISLRVCRRLQLQL